MLAELRKTTEAKMHKSVDAFKGDLAKVRTGRAHTGLLDHIVVDYYGAPTPLNQVAKVTLMDARTIGVAPFEKKMLQTVEKAIRDSDLGLNPAAAGEQLRVPMPALTEERRKELIKVAHKYAEQARVSVRNVRRDGMEALKQQEKDHKITEDEHAKQGKQVQALTDEFIKKIDEAIAAKEKDVLNV